MSAFLWTAVAVSTVVVLPCFIAYFCMPEHITHAPTQNPLKANHRPVTQPEPVAPPRHIVSGVAPRPQQQPEAIAHR